MKKLISLIKIDLNMTFGLSSLSFKTKRKQEGWKLILIIVAIIALIPSYRRLIKGLLKIYAGLEMLNQEASFLLIGIIIFLQLKIQSLGNNMTVEG